jgi:hypothetical protein
MDKPGRKRGGTRRTAAQWSALIAQYSDSAQTQKAFCAARGLAISSFSKALRQTREDGVDVEHARAFVPVVVDNTLERGESSAWVVELTLGAGIVLRIRGV